MRYLILFISFFTLPFLFSACMQEEVKLGGKWKIEFPFHGTTLPVVIELHEGIGGLSAGTLYNSTERMKLEGSVANGQFDVTIGDHYAKLIGQLKDGKLSGHWIRTNKDDFKIPFTGKPYKKLDLYSEYEKRKTILNVSGKWKIQLKEDKVGLGLFTQTGSRVQGSIITTTGDYRFLDGYIEKNKLILTGFDGVFSFVLDLVLAEGKRFNGKMLAGKSTNRDISGLKDDSFVLDDPNSLTSLTKEGPLKLSMQDINGKQIDIDSEEYKGKAKIIQLFGSWCPNCIDESRFFKKWRDQNVAKLNEVSFIAVSFERAKSEKEALKNLKKITAKLGMNYPVILADFDKTKKVTEFFPIDEMRAFPTTLFLNRKNEIVKIHTGFSGQATGEFFDNFTEDFELTINKLISEDI